MPSVPGRLGRAAMLAFGATMALTGCGSSATEPQDGMSADATADGADSGGVVALYGAPALDGAMQDVGGPNDSGGPFPLYGLSPPPDGGG